MNNNTSFSETMHSKTSQSGGMDKKDPKRVGNEDKGAAGGGSGPPKRKRTLSSSVEDSDMTMDQDHDHEEDIAAASRGRDSPLYHKDGSVQNMPSRPAETVKVTSVPHNATTTISSTTTNTSVFKSQDIVPCDSITPTCATPVTMPGSGASDGFNSTTTPPQQVPTSDNTQRDIASITVRVNGPATTKHFGINSVATPSPLHTPSAAPPVQSRQSTKELSTNSSTSANDGTEEHTGPCVVCGGPGKHEDPR